MMTFELEVRRTGWLTKRTALFYNGREVRVPPEFEGDVAKLAEGTIAAGCEYRPGGLVLAQLGGKTVAIAAYEAPKVQRREDAESRRALDEIGEREAPSVAHELAQTVVAWIQAKELDRAARAFPILLAAAQREPSMTVDPPNLAAIRRELPRPARAANAPVWMAWLAGHRETAAVENLLEDVPPKDWPPILLQRALDWHVARKRDSLPMREQLAEMRARAPDHRVIGEIEAMLAGLEREKAKAATRAAKANEQRAAQAMNLPARPETVELGFRITLPREIARAWRRGDARVHLLRELTLSKLLAEGERIRASHFADDPSPAFLPLSREGSATVGLYLSHTRPSGDYAIVRVGETPELVANASSEVFS